MLAHPLIRPVEARDVPAVVALVTEVLAEFDLAFGDGSATDAQLLGLPGAYTSAGGAFWVAEAEDGALVGTIGAYPVRDEVTVELRKMYVLPSTRGTGLGQRLFDVLVAWARERGVARVVLDTTEQMKGAIRFYERNGFARDDAFISGSRCSRGYVLAL